MLVGRGGTVPIHHVWPFDCCGNDAGIGGALGPPAVGVP